MNWKIRLLTPLLFLTFYCEAQQIGLAEDSSILKIRQTGYELLYSHADYNFYEMELLNQSILILQKPSQSGFARLLLLNKEHIPTDTADVNCWPEFIANTNPIIWHNGDVFHFKPRMIWYTHGICNKDQRREKSQLILNFDVGNNSLENFSCEKIKSTDFKDFKKWDMHRHFYHNGTTVSWVEKEKKKLSYGELHIGSRIIRRQPRKLSYVLSQYCLPVNNFLIVLDAVEQKLYWAEEGEIIKTLVFAQDRNLSRIFYDKVSKKLYGDSYSLDTKKHSVYEIDKETGKTTLYATFPYYCYDLSIRNGSLYFIIDMSKIDPEFQTTGLFMKKMIATD
jgi:hypothetical protein